MEKVAIVMTPVAIFLAIFSTLLWLFASPEIPPKHEFMMTSKDLVILSWLMAAIAVTQYVMIQIRAAPGDTDAE